MIRIIIFITLLFLLSCKSTNKSLLFKDTEILDAPPFMSENPKNNFPWVNELLGERDSIFISNRESKKINEILKLYKNKLISKDEVFFPKYAFIKKKNEMIDTIYFNENFMLAYFSKLKIIAKDTTKTLDLFLRKRHNFFFNRNYLYYYNKFNHDD